MRARTAKPAERMAKFDATMRWNSAIQNGLAIKKKEQPTRFEPATASLGPQRSHHLGYVKLLSRKQPQHYLIGAKQKN
jgi:hypothetical protein